MQTKAQIRSLKQLEKLQRERIEEMVTNGEHFNWPNQEVETQDQTDYFNKIRPANISNV